MVFHTLPPTKNTILHLFACVPLCLKNPDSHARPAALDCAETMSALLRRLVALAWAAHGTITLVSVFEKVPVGF